MKQFDIYLQPATAGGGPGAEAVKQGFSWPAFFFTGIWALTKHLWLYGVVLLVVAVSINVVSRYALEEELLGLSAAMALAGLAISIGVGQYGNDWRRRNLAEHGFVASGTVEAQNAKEALAEATAEGGETTETLETQAPQRRFSIGGVVVASVLFLSVIGNLGMMFSEGPFLFSMLLSSLVPAVALLIRSFRPPVGFARGLAVVFGGMMLGMSTLGIEMALLGQGFDGGEAASSLFFLALGAVLLWLGFRPAKPKAAKSE